MQARQRSTARVYRNQVHRLGRISWRVCGVQAFALREAAQDGRTDHHRIFGESSSLQ